MHDAVLRSSLQISYGGGGGSRLTSSSHRNTPPVKVRLKPLTGPFMVFDYCCLGLCTVLSTLTQVCIRGTLNPRLSLVPGFALTARRTGVRRINCFPSVVHTYFRLILSHLPLAARLTPWVSHPADSHPCDANDQKLLAAPLPPGSNPRNS
jgi:hypothetical protein